MFNFLKKLNQTTNNKLKTSAESDAIAAPKANINDDQVFHYNTNSSFIPIDAVLPNQSIPGKFNPTSATWKYIENYLLDRIELLHKKNEISTLSFEKTQLLRGQLKEIKLLLNHTNIQAGIKPLPKKSTLDLKSTVRGQSYE